MSDNTTPATTIDTSATPPKPTPSLFGSREIDDAQATRIGIICTAGEMLLAAISDNTKPSRESSLAVTNLEQAIMWANKAVARQPEFTPPQ